MVRQLTTRHTITIPKKNLESVGADSGIYFEVTDDGTRIILTPKNIEDRFTDAEWEKLDALRKAKGKTYPTAAQAKAHVRGLAR